VTSLGPHVCHIEDGILEQLLLYANAVAVGDGPVSDLVDAEDRRRRERATSAALDLLQIAKIQGRVKDIGGVRGTAAVDVAAVPIIEGAKASPNDGLPVPGGVPGHADPRLPQNPLTVEAARRIAGRRLAETVGEVSGARYQFSDKVSWLRVGKRGRAGDGRVQRPVRRLP
jgi:hypothetical protein